MEIRYCRLPIANLWLSPESIREEDGPSLKGAEGFYQWLNSLDTERRKGLTGRLESQLLLGEPAMVIEEREDWVKVCLPHQSTRKDARGYPGWVYRDQLTFHSRFDKAFSNSPYAWVTADQTIPFSENGDKEWPLSFMTRLPCIGKEDNHAIVLTPEGATKRLALSDVFIAETLPITPPSTRLPTAERFLGLSYLWGGMSSFGFDCSGFVHRILAAHGLVIPRDASDQAQQGIRLTKEELLPGDLVFFAHEKGQGAIHHVGMVIGEQSFIHSPNSGHPVRINALSDEPYGAEFCWGVRY
ncbi:NlpC/P60 family protein [Marininema mesophilum]|uniref:NlpC/P60 family protein n=1 Tax=Marininema mesophilum TaxID=1048340 RepID=A0A1H2QZA9_9BACL|nr:C40 family peptidase [Marininema mesophilum]SDW12268.1 NlpC/P60 family protein [Marininema mesophilum]